MTRIASVAGFGAPNYGDLLYALMMKALIGDRADVEFYGLPSTQVAPSVPMSTIASLYEDQPQAVIVGGGDILRTDWHTVALDHVGRSGSALPARAWDRWRAGRYQRRELAFDAPGPFVVDPRRLKSGPPVAYVSCAVPGPVPVAEAAAFADALNQAAFLCVRDERSRSLLVDAGVDRATLQVAPDCVLALPDVLPSDALQETGEELLRHAGVPASTAPIVFQLAPWLAVDREPVLRFLAETALQGRQLVGLPMGAYSGEHNLLSGLFADVPGSVVLPVLGVTETAAVLAAAAGVVASSFHAGITAGVYGRTVAFVPGAERKAQGLMVALDAEPSDYIAGSWDDPLLHNGAAFDPEALRSASRLARQAVAAAIDAVLPAVPSVHGD